MGLNLSATRFAHLLGPFARTVAHASSARADDDGGDDDDKDARAESDDGGDDDKKDDKDSKKAKRAKKARAADDGGDDDDEAHAEDDDGDEARAESEDDGDDDKKDDSNAKHAHRAERARCAAIFRCNAAGTRPDVAAHLAFETSMRAPDAVALLTAIASGDGTRAAHADSLRSRMAGVRVPAIASDAGAALDRDGPQAAATLILAAAGLSRGAA